MYPISYQNLNIRARMAERSRHPSRSSRNSIPKPNQKPRDSGVDVATKLVRNFVLRREDTEAPTKERGTNR